MSITYSTLPPLTGAAIAEGLRALADVFERGTIDSGDFLVPEQAIRVTVVAKSAGAVVRVADALDQKVERDGLYIHAEVPFGVGTAPDTGMASYAGAVEFSVGHIAEEVA